MAITLCCDSPLPTFSSLHASLMESLEGHGIPELTIPKLPGIRNPIYNGFSHPVLELSQLVQELQHYQVSLTMLNIFKPIADFLGGALEELLPKVPGTDLTLLDIIAMKTDRIYDAIQQAIENGFKFPMLPDPIFPDLSIPALDTVATVKAVLRDYPASLLKKIKQLIDIVTGQLALSAIFTIPPLPTRQDVELAILAAFPTFDRPLDILTEEFSVSKLFMAFTVPGFPPLILPEPLVTGFSSFSLELDEAISIFQADALSSLLQPVIDFCQDTLGQLGFEFPTICIEF